MNPPLWSPGLVTAAVRHPLSMRMYAEAPYTPELYESDLEQRIVHPRNVRRIAMARPLVLRRCGRTWWLPGSAEDLLLHTSSVVACCSALVAYLGLEQDRIDHGPPYVRELAADSWGCWTMRAYWSSMSKQVQMALEDGSTHVVFADIADCIASLDPGRMSRLLNEVGADSAAIRVLDDMQHGWQTQGCRGLPLTPGFRVLLKLYLKSVDDRLLSAGLNVQRLQDDFRILCTGARAAHEALQVLKRALSACGLALNQRKTFVLSKRQLLQPIRWRISWARMTNSGIGQPVLADALMHPMLRPLALRSLSAFYGRRCRSK